jgi:DNA-binding response OmpR family regulator
MDLQADMNTQSHAPRTDTSLAHVLAIDDDPILREAVADYLGQHEFRVTAVADGRAMQAVLAGEVVDLIVLDLKLQTEDGMALARRLREESTIPIIMLTGRSEEADRVMGLELGADDYLTKPFSPRTLLARIKALMRRAGMENSGPLASGRIQLNVEDHTVQIGSEPAVRLTKLELRLLQMLLVNAGRTVGSDRLLVHIWGHRNSGDRQLLKQLVHRLRQKIEKDPSLPQILQTATGAGYKLVVE